jgi:hypothetical protein
VLTFEDYLVRHAPRDRAYSVADLREGWEACFREFPVHEWEFRVISPIRGKWHVIPFVCIQPMLELFGHEIEVRPIYMARGNRIGGVDMLLRLNRPEPIPF